MSLGEILRPVLTVSDMFAVCVVVFSIPEISEPAP
jgi:hypothetical protein